MARIRKILGWKNNGDHAIVTIVTDDGDETYTIYIGGAVELYHHNGVNKAFVKRRKDVES